MPSLHIHLPDLSRAFTYIHVVCSTYKCKYGLLIVVMPFMIFDMGWFLFPRNYSFPRFFFILLTSNNSRFFLNKHFALCIQFNASHFFSYTKYRNKVCRRNRVQRCKNKPISIFFFISGDKADSLSSVKSIHQPNLQWIHIQYTQFTICWCWYTSDRYGVNVRQRVDKRGIKRIKSVEICL